MDLQKRREIVIWIHVV